MPSVFDALLNPEGDDQERIKATVGALKRQQQLGQIGQLMNVEPTMNVGAQMVKGAQQSFGDALQAQQQARAAKVQQQQYAAQAAHQNQMQSNWERSFAESQAREKAMQKERDAQRWQMQTNPVTGEMFEYNPETRESRPFKPAAGPPPPGGKPMGPTGFPELPQGIKMPENAVKNYVGTSMLAEHLPALESLLASGYEPSRTDLMAVGPPQSGPAGRIQDVTPRALAGKDAQQYFATGGKVLTAILRPESGGAITADEWNQYGPLYLPWPGDDPETRQKKVVALREYMRRLAAGSGPASAYFQEPPGGATSVDFGVQPPVAPGTSTQRPRGMPQTPQAGDKYLQE